MKTQILHLEAHDDVASVGDQIDRSQSNRILLVWPARPGALQTRLDLQLLHRRAAALGARLALVCRQSKFAHHAAQLGIPVFRTIRLAQNIPWEDVPLPARRATLPRPTRPVTELRARANAARLKSAPRSLSRPLRISAFGAGVAAFALLVGIFVPRAEIRLQPSIQAQSLTLTLIADPTLTGFTLAGALPLRAADVVVEGRQTIPTTGLTVIPFKAAEGKVVFTNLTQEAVELPAGLLIQSTAHANIRFSTLSASSLPAEVATEVTVDVIAESPGIIGNLPANSIDRVEGELGLKVSVTNPDPISGGQEQDSRAPAPEDFDSLRAELTAALWESALAEAVSSDLIPGLLLAIPTRQMTILEETFTPPPPQPGDELTLLLRANFSLPYIPQEQLDQFARAALDASLPDGFTPIRGTLLVSSLDIPVLNPDGTIALAVSITRSLQSSVPTHALLTQIAGKSEAEALGILQSAVDLQSPPILSRSPAWFPVLPLFPWQIRLRF